MTIARFILDRKKVIEQYNKLRNLGVKISYSFKTNKEVGKVLQEEEDCRDCEFSIHSLIEIDEFDEENRNKLWFFSQAWYIEKIKKIIDKGVKNFVIDNEKDLEELLRFVDENEEIVNILLRMKFQEHRIGSGKYFTYGMSSRKISEIIGKIKNNPFIDKLGIHIHRKSQNVSEWNIREELEDSLSEEVLERLNIINVGGGFPVKYRTYTSEVLPYIFDQIKEVKVWLADKRKSGGKEIEVYVEPGRFIAAPPVKLEAEVIQVYDNIIVINTSIYNCALDTVITDIRLLVEGELDDKVEGNFYKIKGNTPTRDDIFRYKVKFRESPKVGDKIIFLNAGAYNYTTDFCGLEKLETKIIK